MFLLFFYGVYSFLQGQKEVETRKKNTRRRNRAFSLKSFVLLPCSYGPLNLHLLLSFLVLFFYSFSFFFLLLVVFFMVFLVFFFLFYSIKKTWCLESFLFGLLFVKKKRNKKKQKETQKKGRKRRCFWCFLFHKKETLLLCF